MHNDKMEHHEKPVMMTQSEAVILAHWRCFSCEDVRRAS